MTDYGRLPTEILIKIFHFLDFYDIQAAKLCCKQWFMVTKLPEFDSKIVFKVITGKLDSKHPGAKVIFDNRIQKLYLKSVQLSDDEELFGHIGSTLKTLTLKLVPIADALRLTFKYFTNLQSLKVCRIKLPMLIEDVEYLPFGDLSRLKELELIGNDSCVNKYLLICSMHAHSLEKLTVEFSKKDELQVLNILNKQAKALNRLHLHFYEGRPLEVSQWTTIVPKLNLKELSIQGNFSSDVMFAITRDQKSLRSLNVTGSVAVNDEYLTLIGKELPQLERLILAYCGRITNNGVTKLPELSKLTALDLTCCNQITSEGIRSIIGKEPNLRLQELHMPELNLNEDVVCFFANNLPRLRILNLSGCGKAVTDVSIQQISDCQRNLRELRIDNCMNLSDKGMLGLSTGSSIQNLDLLQRLSLRGCKQLSDDTLSALRFPHLKSLDISYCDHMTNLGIPTLVQNCPSIEEFSFTRSKKMDHEAVHVLTNGLGRLRTLTVTNCRDILQLGSTNWKQCHYRKFTNEVTLKRYLKRSKDYLRLNDVSL